MRQERCELVPVQSPAGVAVELSKPPVQILGRDLEPLLVQRRALLFGKTSQIGRQSRPEAADRPRLNWRLNCEACAAFFRHGALPLQFLQLLVLFEREQPLRLRLNHVLRAVSLQ